MFEIVRPIVDVLCRKANRERTPSPAAENLHVGCIVEQSWIFQCHRFWSNLGTAWSLFYHRVRGVTREEQIVGMPVHQLSETVELNMTLARAQFSAPYFSVTLHCDCGPPPYHRKLIGQKHERLVATGHQQFIMNHQGHNRSWKVWIDVMRLFYEMCHVL